MELNDLQSNNYWRRTQKRIKQKYYIAFSLINSALFDFSVGLDLKKQNKLNWSASCFYYSMVHCARLLVFIPCGNFPTGHSDILKLLNNGNLREYQNKWNWLDYFIGNSREEMQFKSSVVIREDIINYYNSFEIGDFNDEFFQFIEILNAAKGLREDSNYEALLISHENFHERFSILFRNLSNIFKTKSEKLLTFVINLFKNFIDSEENINIRNDLKIYINYYINTILKKRIYSRLISQTSVLELNRIIYKIHFINEDNLLPEEFNRIINSMENDISMSQFDEKSRLFSNFNQKIQQLNDAGVDINDQILEEYDDLSDDHLYIE